MKTNIIRIIVTLFSVISFAQELSFAPVFTNNMVLQQKEHIVIWGFSNPKSNIKLSITNTDKVINNYNTVTTNNGVWSIKIAPLNIQENLKIDISNHKTKLAITNIAVGDVWLAGGQSNMDWDLGVFADNKNLELKKEVWKHQNIKVILEENQTAIEKSTNTNLRIVQVDKYLVDNSIKPYDNKKLVLKNKWASSSPRIINKTSAIGYFFGKHLQEKLKIPIGVIDANKGGTPLRCWLLPNVLKEVDTTLTKKKRSYVNGVLYAGMIQPLSSFPIKGVVWYQGEANSNKEADANDYDENLTLLINLWRKAWNKPDLPFIIAQLPGHLGKEYPTKKKGIFWPITRENQYEVSLLLENVATTCLIDLGFKYDIHPPLKQEVGKRLANDALSLVYKQHSNISASYKSHTVKGKNLLVTFTNVGVLGLKAKDVYLDGDQLFAKKLQGFEIAGADKVFYGAKSFVKNSNTVSLCSKKVKKPMYVRYAWKDFPLANLYNTANLPTYPFDK
ncbi:sialate O-acetylesterase [Flavobacteriaceae bacterium]|nr:sialate O-acetylesterase [Flavobacteriaceae bacterium]